MRALVYRHMQRCLCAGQQQNADGAVEGLCTGLNWQTLSKLINIPSECREEIKEDSSCSQHAPDAFSSSKWQAISKPGTFPYLTRLEIILHTVLKAFSFGLQRCHDETVSHKVSRVTNSFTGAKTVENKEKWNEPRVFIWLKKNELKPLLHKQGTFRVHIFDYFSHL